MRNEILAKPPGARASSLESIESDLTELVPLKFTQRFNQGGNMCSIYSLGYFMKYPGERLKLSFKKRCPFIEFRSKIKIRV